MFLYYKIIVRSIFAKMSTFHELIKKPVFILNNPIDFKMISNYISFKIIYIVLWIVIYLSIYLSIYIKDLKKRVR